MAEISLRHGRPDAAKAMLVRALERVEDRGEVYHLAEIHRLQAELAWMTGGADDVAAICGHLSRAFDVAEDQMAAIWIRRNAQSAQRLHGLVTGGTSPNTGYDVDLDGFTDDEVELAQQMSHSRRLIQLMDTGAAA